MFFQMESLERVVTIMVDLEYLEDETYQLDFLYHRIKHPMNKIEYCVETGRSCINACFVDCICKVLIKSITNPVTISLFCNWQYAFAWGDWYCNGWTPEDDIIVCFTASYTRFYK